jgi:hypothetical protein
MQKLDPKSSQQCNPPERANYSMPAKGEIWFFMNGPALITDVKEGGIAKQWLIYVLHASGNKAMYDGQSVRDFAAAKRVWKIA